MCIRDRVRGLDVKIAYKWELSKTTYRTNYLQKPLTNQHKGCLLYTSDAADERSSVDLGGRRIIKKKKK